MLVLWGQQLVSKVRERGGREGPHCPCVSEQGWGPGSVMRICELCKYQNSVQCSGVSVRVSVCVSCSDQLIRGWHNILTNCPHHIRIMFCLHGTHEPLVSCRCCDPRSFTSPVVLSCRGGRGSSPCSWQTRATEASVVTQHSNLYISAVFWHLTIIKKHQGCLCLLCGLAEDSLLPPPSILIAVGSMPSFLDFLVPIHFYQSSTFLWKKC